MSSPTGGMKVHPSVEEKAKLLQDNNQDTYRALADEVFRAPRTGFSTMERIHGFGLNSIPAPISGALKDRLVYAEMRYRQGKGAGVTEQNIVDFTNMLAQQLDLPAYTHTNLAQVRSMRMALIHYNPTFMGYGIQPDMKPGDSISQNLSPFQATHLLLEVLGHKISDPTFQLEPSDWEAYQVKLNAWRQQQPATGPATQMSNMLDGSKGSEVRQRIANRVKTMNMADAAVLLDKGLEVFQLK
jgi:hypothetical protein